MKISVVMPVYNECWTIREIVRRVLHSPEPVHELIMVDDGSKDGTRELIRGLEKKYAGHRTKLRVIFREKNGGKGAALVDGFAAAEGDIVVVQDADHEYSPEDYPQLVAPIRAGQADAVYGSRFMGGKRNVLFFWHSIANWLLTIGCNMVSNLNLTDVWTGYKVFRADLIKKIPLKSRGFDFEPEITVKLAKLGARIYEVPVSYHGRGYAEGKKIGLKDAFIGVWATISTALWGDLGDLAVGEQTLRIMAKAGRYNRFIYDQYREHLGPAVVELGSGVGNVSRFLLDREKLLLTENEPAYLSLLQASFGGWGYIDIRPLDITARPPKELAGAFDTAVCFNVIEHVENDAAAVATIADLLKKDGKAVLIVPAHQGLFGSLDKHLLHFRRYDREGFTALLEKAGFETLEARYLNPIAVPGWWLNGKIFGRKVIPGFQLALFDRLTPLVAWASGLGLNFGLSLFVVARKKA
jgi:glycosyltransferase involved in cell wall biosynthesis